jgi:hypothetical protein
MGHVDVDHWGRTLNLRRQWCARVNTLAAGVWEKAGRYFNIHAFETEQQRSRVIMRRADVERCGIMGCGRG